MWARAVNLERALSKKIKGWGHELGFQHVGIAGIHILEDEARLARWLSMGYHGSMEYMQRHGIKRSRPGELLPGTISVITARMDYLPGNSMSSSHVLARKELGYISRYALGRDYHKVLRSRLQTLAHRITELTGHHGYRVFVDSAPVLEKALARTAGLGWIGKHTCLINRNAGSWFFLGEIYTDLPLPTDSQTAGHCGTCQACLDICPTGAILAPYQLDARRCISYLTIEHQGPLPEDLRPLLGNRIYGCDDCQLVCPWNRFSRETTETDYLPRNGLDAPELTALFAWSEGEFLRRTEGSAIRRIGHERWLRNIAVALGNADSTPETISALQRRISHPAILVREHVSWALQQHLG
ncbi:MAG: tRNA epoxyqueuosine(34) reductase QueG [Gammaproteobacteria bacterium]|nr:tRNA epoxyqueuosine(34) reductase QueG [Gammaproteobacteria bacterium]